MGKESLPVSNPLEFKMTEMKWRHVLCSKGYWEVLVTCFTSVTDMLPSKLPCLSMTAMEEILSTCIL